MGKDTGRKDQQTNVSMVQLRGLMTLCMTYYKLFCSESQFSYLYTGLVMFVFNLCESMGGY